MNNNKNKKEEKGELDLTYNFDDDVFNVTQEQMDILDGDVNKIYNRYKNNIEFNNFRLNHPKLQYKNRYDNNYGYIDNHITKEERQKRISPIIEKQKLILEKIKKDNISRSNILLNNDPDNQTKNKITKSNKFIYPYKLNQINNLKGNIFTNNNQKNNELYSSSNHNTIDFNNYNNNNIFSNYKNNNIMRYQNLYINNGPLSSEDRSNISSKYKINKDKRKINYKPYTLFEYKKKYENNEKNKILGGLGANIGGEEWVNRQKTLERKRQYSDYVKSDNEYNFKNQNKIKLKLKNDNYETTKTISSKKSSEFSNGKSTQSNNKNYNVIKTENNIINKKPIILPLIKERHFSNKENNNKGIYNSHKKKNKMKDNYILNPINQKNGNEKDLKELIKQYEEYNGKF